MNYREKEIMMNNVLTGFESKENMRSLYKSVPFSRYAEVVKYIDFTKYYVMFRGPRNRGASSTRKRDAKAFDVYMRSARDTNILRTEREAFMRGVNWAKDNV